MNRFVRTAAAAALLAGASGSVGCVSTTGEGGGRYRNYVDPCYPERYNRAARDEVLAAFGPQVNNGIALHQTVWNWHFEAGSDVLNPAGKAKLDSFATTRPEPNPKIYVQVARDVAVTPENAEKVVDVRNDLTARRAAAILRYMSTQPSIAPVAYEIWVHDPVVPGIPADFSANAYRGQAQGYRGGIGGASGTTATSTGGGGPTPAASAIGTGPGGPPAGGTSSPSGPSGPGVSGGGR